MKNANFSFQKKAVDFSRKFNCNAMVLFVGKGTNSSELSQLAKCPWSCVLTTQTDPQFSAIFQNDERIPIEYITREQIPARPLSRTNLPVLRLCGVEGQASPDTLEDEQFLASLNLGDTSTNDEQARKILQLLPALLDCVNQMAVTGYQPDVSGELSLQLFFRILMSVPNGNVNFWGITEDFPYFSQFSSLSERKGFSLNSENLSAIIEQQDVEIEQTPFDEGADHFYINGTPFTIQPDELLPYNFMGTLMTEHLVYANQPYGKLQYEKWFANFLELSPSNGPQWYGYLPRSTFYVKRSYEDTLVYMMRRLLSANKGAESGPIVLTGDPGSSKSITLGALAYRIYSEKIYPVIYIHQDKLIFYDGSPELDALDRLMRHIEALYEGTRILVVWDSSSYRTGVKRACDLVKLLKNRGRRFVLACSAYNTSFNSSKKDIQYFKADCQGESIKLENCDSASANLIKTSNYTFIPTTRTMTEKELADLKSKFKEYSGIDSTVLQGWFKRLEKESDCDIFDYLYRLIALLRPHLEEGLSREQRKVSQYVNEHLANILEKSLVGSSDTTLAQAFRDAGLNPEDFPELEGVSVDAESDTLLDSALDRFNLVIAMFSRFHLDVPSNLAFSLLLQKSKSNSIYDSNNLELFRFTTTIPWLYYGEGGSDGNFVFRFRNSLEASIFLERRSFSGQSQLELLSNIIDIYAADYKRTNCIDIELTSTLQDFLRLMGPNSRYTPFQKSNADHAEILKRLDIIINKLNWMLNECGVPDSDMGFSTIIVTFTREFYGKLWDSEPTPENFVLRLKNLRAAMSMARNCVEKLDTPGVYMDSLYLKHHLSEQRDTLVVEIAQCNSMIQKIESEYQTLYPDNKSIAASIATPEAYISYPEIFRMLEQVILKQPNNGYAYNILFKAFLDAHKVEQRPDLQMQYMSEIMQIVSLCSDLEIYNRGALGKDEISENIAAIEAISNKYQISIDEIHNRSAKANDTYLALFDKLLEANNPSAITFICQKELARAGIVFRLNRSLNLNQIMVCKKVRDFMREPANYDCIANQSRALAMLIRISWMCYNETPLLSDQECQITCLTREQWLDICSLCQTYWNREDSSRYQPIIVLLYALSIIHTSGDYAEAVHKLNSLDEGQFYNSRRMWTPFLICNENGAPIEFTGKVLPPKNTHHDLKRNATGSLYVSGISEYLGNHTYIRFRSSNLGMNNAPTAGSVFRDIQIGLGYTGLSAYRKLGLKD